MADVAPLAEGDRGWLSEWLPCVVTPVGTHQLRISVENVARRHEVEPRLCEVVLSHYVSSDVLAARLEALGAPQTAALMREQFPTSKQARSGDFGEILATELTESQLGYLVPIRRLRWKDGREMALRGDDLFAIARSANAITSFLKGESKSRANLSNSVVNEAGTALDSNQGRPTRHSVLFVADRLRERDRHDEATELELAVLNGFQQNPIEHLLFVVTGSDPTALLTSHLTGCGGGRRPRHAVGVQISDHPHFIRTLFESL